MKPRRSRRRNRDQPGLKDRERGKYGQSQAVLVVALKKKVGMAVKGV